MKLKLFSADGTKSKNKDFVSFPTFDDDKGVAALRQVVIAHQANRRQGTASTKTRAEVAGSGKKLFRQKGSGKARQGTRRVPHQRHGGVAHGPKPRDFSQKINRKMKSLAFQRALFERATDGGISVIESIHPRHKAGGMSIVTDDTRENGFLIGANGCPKGKNINKGFFRFTTGIRLVQ